MYHDRQLKPTRSTTRRRHVNTGQYAILSNLSRVK